ncbi:unnamed protein product [Staurois parvus]|uniref:Secreted protein n=1 Tax=Staurois parvus TaxID=386267 RepID=A0ABN9DY01_9NEOB|nr:unnamed protein product [Staurois parvus]
MHSGYIRDTFLLTVHTTCSSGAVLMQFVCSSMVLCRKNAACSTFFLHLKLTGTDCTSVNQDQWNTWKTLCMHF